MSIRVSINAGGLKPQLLPGCGKQASIQPARPRKFINSAMVNKPAREVKRSFVVSSWYASIFVSPGCFTHWVLVSFVANHYAIRTYFIPGVSIFRLRYIWPEKETNKRIYPLIECPAPAVPCKIPISNTSYKVSTFLQQARERRLIRTSNALKYE
jgi:hypothetical protein